MPIINYKSKSIEISGTDGDDKATHSVIDWMYPDMYSEEDPSTLEICLFAVRAADNIRIKYSSERDGWVIEQAAIFSWDIDDEECDSDWQEVAFVKAWARERSDRIS